MSLPAHLRAEAGPDEARRAALREHLGAFNVRASDAFRLGTLGELDVPQPVELYLYDAAALVGGASGFVRRRWLDTELLWVADSQRGHGLGAWLLRWIERQAAALGARHAKLTTFDFQARGFYKRLGYAEYGVLEDYPEGCTLYLLRRTL